MTMTKQIDFTRLKKAGMTAKYTDTGYFAVYCIEDCEDHGFWRIFTPEELKNFIEYLGQ